MQQIAATRRRDRLLQQIASRDMWKSLSLRSVAQIQTGLNSCNISQRQTKRKRLVAAAVQTRRLVAAAIFPFVNRRCHFRDTINKFLSAKLEKKGNYVFNHLASNPEPLLPNIPFIPVHYQVDGPIFRKILLQSLAFLNVNERATPNNK